MTSLFAAFRSGMRFAAPPLVAICVGLLSALPASAQTSSNAPSYTDLSNLLLSNQGPVQLLRTDPNLPQAPGSNFSAINQRGANDSASTDVTGAANTTIQLQTGIGSSSTFTVVGNQNVVGTLQLGNNDHSSISVVGQSNRITDVQIGSNLSFGLQQIGNGANVFVQQVRR